MSIYIILLIALALLFDFLNGFHDAANSIATVVSTRVLSPRYAVVWAAFFNFVAFLFFGLHVAGTIGSGIIDVSIIDNTIITSYFGIPVSTTHTITGAIMGVGTLRRFTAVRWGIAGQIIWSWILTIPLSAFIAAIAYIIAAKI
ncbi:MAG TPA: inorganic phosphate transporter [Candidatus Hydrogenedens sp.]|nr:inorganic phosphate transporter [Candidatus Hydrogenedens sp.]